MKLNNKVAFVTGGTSGIGKAIAERFVEEGARVMVAGIARKKLHVSNNLKFIHADISRESDVKNALEKTRRTFGKIDIVVNNAGVWGHRKYKNFRRKN